MATWYISPTGNDTTGNGSSALPWLTISKAHTSAASGDTIICKVSATAYTWASQTFTKNLTIQGESVPVYNPVTKAWTGAIFDGAAANVSWDDAQTSLRDVTVEQLIFRNAKHGSRGYFSNLRSIIMRRCVFETLETILTSGGEVVVFRCGALGVLTMENSIVRGDTFAWVSDVFIQASEGGTLTMTANVMYGMHRIYAGAANLHVNTRNNIFVAPSSYAFFVTSSIIDAFNNNTTINYTSVPSGSNNLTTDPLFVDPANGDFRLRPGSPAINAGVAL